MYKFLKIIVLTLILSLFMILGLTAQNEKVMTAKQYLDNIKIKQALNEDATAYKLLIELFEKHGANPEAVYIYEITLAKMFDNTDDPDKRTEYLEKMYSFSDSLNLLCLTKDKKEIKAVDNCPKYVKAVDSIKFEYRQKLYGEK